MCLDHVEDNGIERSDNRRNNKDGFVKHKLSKLSGPKFVHRTSLFYTMYLCVCVLDVLHFLKLVNEHSLKPG